MPVEVNERPKVTIVARNDGKGKGILWDHLTIRSLVKCETYVAYNQAMETEAVSRDIVESNQSFVQHSHFLSPGDYGQGLLVIAGRAREIRPAHQAAHDARLDFEQAIIKDALENKRPILAICGGSWSLWHALGGRYELVKVNGHDIVDSHPDDDIYLEDSGRVHSNVQVHNIAIESDSALAKAMALQVGETILPVNSIHQHVVDEKTCPPKTMITARAKHSLLNNPELSSDTVEAFETDDGLAIGVQFHPEAYAPSDPSYQPMQRLFNYMVKAGQAYDKRRQKHFFFEKTLDRSENQFEERGEVDKAPSPS